MTAFEAADTGVVEEDLLRAQVYLLLARFLARPPSSADLKLAAGLHGDASDLGKAIATLSKIAGHTTREAMDDEYHVLFIGVGRGELVPYGSYYLTGFLNEKPLAKLRNDMTSLGIEREDGISDPEDHIAAVCEMMAGLIAGAYGPPVPLEEQRAFFDKHVGSWARYFFEDLEAARSSTLYAAIGAIGKTFMDIEKSAFEMIETQPVN